MSVAPAPTWRCEMCLAEMPDGTPTRFFVFGPRVQEPRDRVWRVDKCWKVNNIDKLANTIR